MRESRRTFVIHPEGQSELHTTTRPPSWPKDVAWRPMRHFGRFRAGSDLNQIQVLVDKRSASWYYNGYFASFTPDEVTDAEPVWRIYFRRNYFEDTPAQATLPTETTPQLSHAPGGDGQGNWHLESHFPHGYINDMLFSLASVSWSSRFGGTAALEFRQTSFTGPNEPSNPQEDFELEAVRDVGADKYRFDLNDVSMHVYVTPHPGAFNPKNQATVAMPAHVQFAVGRVDAYKNGTAVPASSVEQLLRETLDTAAATVARSLGGNNRSPASVFTLGFIHNQFQHLIGANDKVTRIYISDEWLDLVTEQYQPYIFSSIRIEEIWTSGPAQGAFEGEPEWKVVTRVYETPKDAPEHRLLSRTDIVGDDEATPGVSLGAYVGVECDKIDHVRVRYDITEVDPLSPDDDVGGASRNLHLNCAEIAAQMALPSYTGFVEHGVLPVRSGELLSCGAAFTKPKDQIDPWLYCENGHYLQGRLEWEVDPPRTVSIDIPIGGPGIPPTDRPGENIPPRKAYVKAQWRARVAIGAR
jgi:hypothetical protein